MDIVTNMGALGETVSIFYNTMIEHGVSEEVATEITKVMVTAALPNSNGGNNK